MQISRSGLNLDSLGAQPFVKVHRGLRSDRSIMARAGLVYTEGSMTFIVTRW